MSGLALIVLKNGAKVRGSDITSNAEVKKLVGLGAEISIGHNGENIDKNISLVVYSSAIHEDNPEILKAKELGIRCIERAEFLGEIAGCYEKVIAIAGTHGKTTTTAIIGEMLKNAGLDPTIHLGGESIGLKGNTIIGANEYFVVEACEYMESFRYLKPHVAVITNIELDHVDYYKDYDSIHSAFTRFAENSDILIAHKDARISHKNLSSVFRDWQVKHTEFVGNGYNFNVFFKEKYYATFRLNMLGIHNVYNALFAIAVGFTLGISREVIENTLSGFMGVERRYQNIFTYPSGCRVIVDYAHHPTEIEKSVQGIKDIYNRTLYVFQPHTYSRTKELFAQFQLVLSSLDNIVIFETYPARENEIIGGRAEDLFTVVNLKNKWYFDNNYELMSFMRSKSTMYDCILVLGAGDLAEKLQDKLHK